VKEANRYLRSRHRKAGQDDRTDGAIQIHGDRLFKRSVLAPLVLQGAVEGWLMSNQMLLCPGIGAAMPLGE
jgi:hypothetical protein